mgnify:CR=1 FL=1
MAKVVHSDRAHSELPPSSADKWMRCWGWRSTVAEHVELYGVPPSSAAAEEGTRAHEKLERALLGEDFVPESLPGQGVVDAEGWGDYVRDNRKSLDTSDSEFDHLMQCLEWVQRQVNKEEGTFVLPETRLDFGKPMGFHGLTGTVDLTIVSPSALHIGDLKYGRGIVELRDERGRINPQLGCYLVGAIEAFGDRDRYFLTILQPRAPHPEGPIRTIEVSQAELAVFRFDLENAIEGNYKGSPCSPGPHCRKFCPAQPTCKALKQMLRQRMRMEDPDG